MRTTVPGEPASLDVVQLIGTLGDHLPVALAVTDLTGQFLVRNAPWISLSGRSDPASLAGMTAPADRPRHADWFAGLRAGAGEPLEAFQEFVRPDGSSFEARLRARALRTDEGGLIGAVLVLDPWSTPVAELRRLQAARDRAERAAAAGSAFVAKSAHDLRNPLHLMAGRAELLARHADPDVVVHAEAIGRDVRSLELLVNDLLVVTTAGAGAIVADPTPTDLGELLRAALEDVQRTHDSGALTVSCHVAPDLPALVAIDELRVRRVLVNLVSNAIKYTPSGSVRLRADRSDGDRIRIEVADTGPGIAPDRLERVFEPFAGIGTELTRGGSTTGLGLSIVRDLTAALGGEVSVRSTLGVGTTFTIVVPAPAVTDDHTDDACDRTSAPSPTHLRVLVVDDSPLNLELARQQLMILGHDAVTADSGEEGLARIDTSVDVVLMDLNMPGIDGLETTRRLRAQGWRTPILALTAAALASDRAACMEAGMNGFLAKPLGLDALARALDGATTPLGLDHAAAATNSRPATNGASDEHGGSRLDFAMIQELVRDAGATAAAMLLRTFLTECTARLDGVHQAAAAGDDSSLRRHAHTLASTARLVGGIAVHDLARSAEAGGLAVADARFLEALDAACSVMSGLVAEHAATLEAP
jgi:signal transduction histidine kinase/CheY-like chemotaxis protein